VTQDEPHVLVS